MTGPETAPRAAPVIVVSERRTGSNFLANLIEQHPDVTPCGELLRPVDYPDLRGRRGPDAAAFVAGLLEESTPSCGKLMFHQMEGHDVTIDLVVGTLRTAPRIIVLFRRRLIDQYISLLTAEQSGRWVHSDYVGVEPVHVDHAAFHEFCKRSRHRHDTLFQSLDSLGLRPLVVAYEELHDTPHLILDSIVTTQLGLSPATRTDKVKKQETRPLDQRVTNPGVAARLDGEPWARHDYATTLSRADDHPKPSGGQNR